MPAPTSAFPSLYQLNTRVRLTELSRILGRTATIEDIPDTELDRLAEQGFDWLWLLSVWQTGAKGREISRTNPDWLREYELTLPDVQEEDIPGSGFAITGYDVHGDLGGDVMLAKFRERLRSRGIRLMLDFVPNHIAIDHPWVEQLPGSFIEGTPELITSQPLNYLRVSTATGEKIMAYGRDPYFSGWPDTLQLNYCNPALQEAMTQVLLKISSQCDGLRCDMAMLVLPEVFERTWGKACALFWPQAIHRVRDKQPGFVFMAEVYWDMEWTLQQQGFSYTYDKKLYDRLIAKNARSVREHFFADWDYQVKSARFLENHDEPRAANIFPPQQHEAAAIITFFSPGLRFFHQGQLEGNKKKISPHLKRGPNEVVDIQIADFYSKLLTILKQKIFHTGAWQLLAPVAVNEWNNSFENYVGFAWSAGSELIMIVVNYSTSRSQCFMKLPFPNLAGEQWFLKDQYTGTTYQRNGDELLTRGLYLDEAGWKYYIFTVQKA